MTDIKLYNTMTRRKEPFTPLDAKNVRMYVCGPTVYDRAHIGNARPVVVFDVLFRLLRHVYGEKHVTYVRNFTDIDDKIIDRAKATGRDIGEITRETTGWFLDDMAALGALEPTHMPRATEYVEQMVAMIQKLIPDHAYEAEGHVLFDVGSYKGYGHLSHRSLDEMLEGARVEVAPYKRNAMDFVLWKPSAGDQPGWDSPWGRGRPGWHIECSAMAEKLLGKEFDIHGGGIDLAFPHHENERAQSNCVHGTKRMAQVWMHNGFLQVGGKKMAKSLGNFFTVKDLLDRYRLEFGIRNFGPAIRFRLLMAHYRSPMDAGPSYLEEAASKLDTYRHFLLGWNKPQNESEIKSAVEQSGIIQPLSDDLNTPKALSILDELVAEIRGQIAPAISPGTSAPVMPSEWSEFPNARDKLGCGLEFLGFSLSDLNNFNANDRAAEMTDKIKKNREVAETIETLLKERVEARNSRDFARADAIRDGLEAAGIELRDSPQKTDWVPKEDFDPAKLEALK